MYFLDYKKKYHGGLKLLLVLLFTMLLSMFSTCYAVVSTEYIQYTLETLKENADFGQYSSTYKTLLDYHLNNNGFITSLTNEINSFLNSQSVSSITDYNTVTFTNANSSYLYVTYIFSNCTAPNEISNLGYLRFAYNQGEGRYYVSCYGESSDKIYTFSIRFQNNYNKSYAYVNKSYITPNIGNVNLTDYISLGTYSFNNDLTTFTSNNIACYGLPVAYIPYPITALYSNPYGLILLDSNGNYQPATPEPEPDPEPSGDTPVNPSGEGGGSSGTIDYTNQLNNINTSIDNVNNSVQEVKEQISGDIQKITNSIDNLNNTLTSPADMDNIIITSGDIERCFGLRFYG